MKQISNRLKVVLMVLGGFIADSFLSPPVSPRVEATRLVWLFSSDRFVGSCGACGSKYANGLARRAWVVRSLMDGKAAGQFFDAGSLASDMATANLLLDIDSVLGCKYVLLGQQEIALGNQFLQALKSRDLIGVSLKVEDADVANPDEVGGIGNEGEAQNAEGRGQGGGMVPYAVFLVKDRRVAVTALASTPGSETQWKEIGETLRKAKSEADSVVVFSYLHTPERDRLIGVLGQRIDVVVDALTSGTSSQAGATKIFPVADRYNEVGELTYGKEGVELRFHPIPTDGPRDEEVFDIAELFYRSAPAALREASTSNVVATTTNLNTARPHPCVPCHGKQVEHWQTTRHASAVQTLRDKGNLSPQCLTCHSELYRRTKQLPAPAISHPTSRSEVVDADGIGAEVPIHRDPFRVAEGVSCSSCHGEGLLHALMPRQKGMDIRRAPEEATCRSCHDAANDPDFDFASGYEKVKH